MNIVNSIKLLKKKEFPDTKEIIKMSPFNVSEIIINLAIFRKKIKRIASEIKNKTIIAIVILAKTEPAPVASSIFFIPPASRKKFCEEAEFLIINLFVLNCDLFDYLMGYDFF